MKKTFFHPKTIQKLFILSLLGTFAIGLFIFVSNYIIEANARGKVYSDIQELPNKKIALLLGTSKKVSNGRLNLFFKYRVEAAAKLYHTGKIKHILVSGDNGSPYYNEPMDMLNALLELGVPRQAITLDYAGFRTLDSVVRCKEIFSQNDVVIVSQEFHNQRALFISNSHGIMAIGFNAQSVPKGYALKTEIREYFARVAAVLDVYLLKTQPKFLGEKVEIPV